MPGRSTSSRASRSVRSSRPSTASSKRPHKRPPLPMPVNNKTWPKSFGFTIGGDAPTYILSVEPNSHAHAAGLQPGDQLVELNNQSILHLGAESIMTLARRCPEVPPSIVVVSCVKTCELYRDRNGHFGLTLIGGGPVYVEVVERGGPAMNCGLKAGDMVLEINGLPIKHSDDAKLFVRGAARLKMVIIPGAGHQSVKKIAQRFEAHAQDRKNKADGFFRKLDAVFYNDQLKKETLLALLKRYAKDKKVDAFGRALAGLLDTPTEKKLFEDIRIFVPPKHRDRFDFLVTKDEPARGKRIVTVNRAGGSFGFVLAGDIPVIIETIDRGGAAERAGLRTGDRIMRLNGLNVRKKTHDELVELLKGSGSTPTLVVETGPIIPSSANSMASASMVSSSVLSTTQTSDVTSIAGWLSESGTSRATTTVYDGDSIIGLKPLSKMDLYSLGRTFKEMMEHHLTPDERKVIKKCLRDYHHTRNIDGLIVEIFPILDTNAKRTIWPYIIHILPDEVQEKCKKKVIYLIDRHAADAVYKPKGSPLHPDEEVPFRAKSRNHSRAASYDITPSYGDVVFGAPGEFEPGEAAYMFQQERRRRMRRHRSLGHLGYSGEPQLISKRWMDPSYDGNYPPAMVSSVDDYEMLRQRSRGSVDGSMMGDDRGTFPRRMRQRHRSQPDLRRFIDENDDDDSDIFPIPRRMDRRFVSERTRHAIYLPESDIDFDDDDDLVPDERLFYPRNRSSSHQQRPLGEQFNTFHSLPSGRRRSQLSQETFLSNAGGFEHREMGSFVRNPLAVVADLVSDEEGAAASIRSSQSRSRSVPRSSRSTQQNGHRTPHNESVNNNNNSRNNGKFSPPMSTSGGGFAYSTPLTNRRESDEIGSLDAYQDGRQRSHSRNRQHHHQDNNWSFPDVQTIPNSSPGEHNHSNRSSVSHASSPPLSEKSIQERMDELIRSTHESQPRPVPPPVMPHPQEEEHNGSLESTMINGDDEEEVGSSSHGSMEGQYPISMVPPPPPPPPPPPVPPPPPPIPGEMNNNWSSEAKMSVKRLNWEKLQDTENTVWSGLGDEVGYFDDVIKHLELEEKFSTVSKGKDGKPGKGGKLGLSTPRDRKNQIFVINHKKAHNTAILLGHLRTPVEELKKDILTMECRRLSVAHIQQLAQYAPDTDEVDSLARYAGQTSQLSEPDKFAFEISRVPGFKLRLRALMLKAGFHEKVDELVGYLNMIQQASSELRQSQKLAKALELVLAMGNYMNQGNQRVAGATGFKISFLNELDTTKTSDNKATFLHVVAKAVHSNVPEVINFRDEIPSVPKAVKMSLKAVKDELTQLTDQLNDMDREVERFNQEEIIIDEDDRFSEVMAVFLKEASEHLSRIHEQYALCCDDFYKTAQFFGEDPRSMESATFFSIFSLFITKFAKAHADNMQRPS
ncbi:delphilin isoform X2 [Strongylocentrotus purpuratus]|uniref:Delphilin n=1 Tax=Strongylocentrotus purpuratus TaxID=7668 RepID=A0A7M7SYI9_STRPU|nr:delphilin isoform X2 [Strongylocentrotus purpuratus]